jgi:hypothetical protein
VQLHQVEDHLNVIQIDTKIRRNLPLRKRLMRSYVALEIFRNLHRTLFAVRSEPNFAHGIFSTNELRALVGQNGRSHQFTYVILDDGWWFTRTVTNQNQNVLIKSLKNGISKHFVLCQAQQMVRYAGEFYVTSGNQHSGITLYMNNASGTFNPSEKDLDRLRTLMSLNFPHVQVIVHSREVPAVPTNDS